MTHLERPIKKQSIFLLSCFLIFFGACRNNSNPIDEKVNEALPEEKNSVETIVLAQEDFMLEIVSNGKLSAIQRAELYFENSGIIDSIYVKNGQIVSQGKQIGKLQNDSYKFALQKAEFKKEQVEVDKLDALLSMGYKQEETNISPGHNKIANIRSGYHQAEVQYKEAKLELKKTILTAPFSGKIEGLSQRQYEKANLSDPFCTLINDKRFFIDFPLLETEIAKVSIGQHVNVTPIAGAKQTKGTITEINPRIDENGLVWVKAEVKNPGQYMEGMNVKVSIKQAIPNKLVVPKQAVVLRQNREVLFRYTRGTAYWIYINVLDENESQYSVEASDGAILELGDTVIISNNLNLAHESEVEIK